MRLLFVFLAMSYVGLAWAQDPIDDFTLEYKFNEELETYRIWSVGDQYFITHVSSEEELHKKKLAEKNPEQAPDLTETAIRLSVKQLALLKEKIQELLNFQDVENCETRKISAAFKVKNKPEAKKGCLDGQDPLSQKLKQLSATLLILL